MAVITTINMESGLIASEFPNGISGTHTLVQSPSPVFSGSWSLNSPFQASGFCFKDYTVSTTVYLRLAVRLHINALPIGGTTDIDLIHLNSSAAQVSCLNSQVTTGGAITLRLIKKLGFAQYGSLAINADQWYEVVMLTVIGVSTTTGRMAWWVNSGAGDVLIQDTGVAIDTGLVGLSRISPTSSGDVFTSNIDVFTDDYILDDASYPTYVTWEQEGYQWRRDDGSEVTATAIGAQDTPL